MSKLKESPQLTFTLLQVGSNSTVLAAREIETFFGVENVREFKAAGKSFKEIADIYIPEETRQRVDAEIYEKFGIMIGVRDALRMQLWYKSMIGANRTVMYAHGIVFPDQDRRGTLTTNIAWSDMRPSTALLNLTLPSRLIGSRCKYEQGRQLALGYLYALLISKGRNELLDLDQPDPQLNAINDYLEGKYFVGKKGDPHIYHVYSYHEPDTNRLVGLSKNNPNPPREGLWVKSLHFSVRDLGIRGSSGNLVEIVPALYDPRGKDIESAVIKAKQRSLKAAKNCANGPLIETDPHVKDSIGLRVVVMEGGHPLRDRVTTDLESLFRMYEGFYRIDKDDNVDPNNGNPNRINFRRRQVYIHNNPDDPYLYLSVGNTHIDPLEVQVYSLEDFIREEYEVGEFDEATQMYNGPAHDLYKLGMVSDIAEYLWPYKIYSIDLKGQVKATSYEIAGELGRKQRISPAGYSNT